MLSIILMKKFLFAVATFCLLFYWCNDDKFVSSGLFNEGQFDPSSNEDNFRHQDTRNNGVASDFEHITFTSENDVWNYLVSHRFYSASGTEMSFTYGNIYNAGQLISKSVKVEIINDQGATLHFTSHLFRGDFKLGVIALDGSHFVLDVDNNTPYYER